MIGFGEFVGGTQSLILWALLLASLGLKVFAFADALRHGAGLYPAAGKRTKNIWLLVTGIALAVNIVQLDPLSLLNIVGVVAAGVYLADVRPALQQVKGSGGRGQQGPYGGW